MKKKIAILLTAVLLCLSFTGCTLEGMRKTHLKFDADGNISYNGDTYILLQDERDLLNPELDYEEFYYTTQADVPMLLMNLYGEHTYVSQDGRFLELWYSDIYCRSDVYEEIAALLKNPGDLEYFCFYSQYTAEPVVMSKEDSQWLRSVLEQLEPLENDDSGDDWQKPTEIQYAYYEYVTEVEACSQDLLLRQFSYTVSRTEEGYLFERYNEESGNYETLQFPQEETERLEQVLKLNLEFSW